jgi:hypothetical protein
MHKITGLVLMVGMGWISAGAQQEETAPRYAGIALGGQRLFQPLTRPMSQARRPDGSGSSPNPSVSIPGYTPSLRPSWAFARYVQTPAAATQWL